MDLWLDILLTLDSTVRLATPLILCAMAGLVSERAGIVDIGLEGKLLIAAFAAAAVASLTGSAWVGLCAAIMASMALSAIHGFACITHRGDQIVSGLALTILAQGLTVVLSIALFKLGGQTPTLDAGARFVPITLPGADSLASVPWLGPLYRELISGHSLLVYLAFASVPLIWWMLWRTRFGLRLRAVGEMPAAVDSAGVSVAWLRYRAVLIAGILCGIAGAFLSTASGSAFVREMSAGKGYIALAALIFGKWRPFPVLFACLLFGFLEAAANRLQGTQLPVVGALPVEFILILPYVATVVLLVGFFGKAIPPNALGTPYVKER
jgi:general nucleoside transport system permease protein